MKKCLCCDNQIEKLNHYVCSICFKEIKTIKKDYELLSKNELKDEYFRWLRNKNFTRNPKYQNDYQMKVVAIAEIFKDKYNDSSKVDKIIDFSNKQDSDIEDTKRNEIKEEEFFNEQNKDEKVDLKDINSYYKCKDGHRVISKSEKEIDDFLTSRKIRHYYDLEIDDNTNWRYDFYLPDYDIYIEHWGYKDRKNYLERKNAKKEYYKLNNYKLVESDEDTIKDENNLKKALKELVPDIFKNR